MQKIDVDRCGEREMPTSCRLSPILMSTCCALCAHFLASLPFSLDNGVHVLSTRPFTGLDLSEWVRWEHITPPQGCLHAVYVRPDLVAVLRPLPNGAWERYLFVQDSEIHWVMHLSEPSRVHCSFDHAEIGRIVPPPSEIDSLL